MTKAERKRRKDNSRQKDLQERDSCCSTPRMKKKMHKQVGCTAPAELLFIQIMPGGLFECLRLCVFWCVHASAYIFVVWKHTSVLFACVCMCVCMCVHGEHQNNCQMHIAKGGWVVLGGAAVHLEADPCCCNHESQMTVFKCFFRGLRQGNVELSRSASACVSVFAHHAQSECLCDSRGYCCSFLDASELWLSIASSCACHGRCFVHGKESQPTLLMQGQTCRHEPRVAL